MHGMSSGANQAKASDAASAFLKTLTPLSSATGSTSDPAATTSATPTTDQISQALMAFEKNLFDSLQAQNTVAATSTSSTASPSLFSDPSTNAAAMAATTANATAPAQGMRHPHHHNGGSDAQLAAELNALIAQTASAAASSDQGNGTATASAGTTAAAANATPSGALDQSFKNLLSTLGVTGNNASLNSFLQAMSANVQAA
jgi:hypothetical protein